MYIPRDQAVKLRSKLVFQTPMEPAIFEDRQNINLNSQVKSSMISTTSAITNERQKYYYGCNIVSELEIKSFSMNDDNYFRLVPRLMNVLWLRVQVSSFLYNLYLLVHGK